MQVAVPGMTQVFYADEMILWMDGLHAPAGSHPLNSGMAIVNGYSYDRGMGSGIALRVYTRYAEFEPHPFLKTYYLDLAILMRVEIESRWAVSNHPNSRAMRQALNNYRRRHRDIKRALTQLPGNLPQLEVIRPITAYCLNPHAVHDMSEEWVERARRYARLG